MPRTSKPLKILVDSKFREEPAIQLLEKQGHEVVFMHIEQAGYDLVLSPRAWRILPSLLKHIAVAIKAARAVKTYPKKSTAKKGSRVAKPAQEAVADESGPEALAGAE